MGENTDMMPRQHRKAGTARPPGRVRIIAGTLRGSRLPVVDLPGLRPTSDRVRETLFNWLAPWLPGARVLDLFAGTGALGFEAVSRGAQVAVLVERDRTLAASLGQTAQRLRVADRVRVHDEDALAWLARPPAPGAGPGEADPAAYDVVFLDPPFAAAPWPALWPALAPRLSAGARIYVESPIDAPPPVPSGWQRLREGRTREVRFALYQNDGASPVTLALSETGASAVAVSSRMRQPARPASQDRNDRHE